MNFKKLLVPVLVAAVAGAAGVASIVTAQENKDAKATAIPEMKLPPGWTKEDMQACMAAGTPGKMHEFLLKDVGTWQGKNTMWMYPGGEPMKSESTTTVSAVMGGRYTKAEMAGEMPAMGPYNGMAVYGFDNVSKKFVCTWIDTMATGITTGEGELSADGKTLTWKLSFNCPVTGKPTPIREIDTITGANTKTVEMYTNDPKSGKEYKMMSMEMTRK